MKNKLLNNLGLKIAALILAFIVWFIVVNINDPNITKTVTGVPVTLTNTAYLESQSLSSQLGPTGTVSVTIRGRRSIVEPMTKDDITAVADLTQIVNIDATPIMVPVSVTAGGVARTDLTVTPGNIAITVENMLSQEYIVKATTGDTRPTVKIFEVGELTADPESITISGPESLIRIIDRVVAPVDVSHLVADTELATTFMIYDKNGNPLSESQLASLRFSGTEASGNAVSVYVDLWRVVSDIALNAQVSGTPASGYYVSEIKTTPTTVTLTGNTAAMALLEHNGYKLTIPSELLDVTGKTEAFTEKIDLSTLLPDGLRLAENVSSNINVRVEILAMNTKALDIPMTSVEQRNLGEGLAVVFPTEKYRVIIQALDEQLESLSENMVRASIDLNGMDAGSYDNVPLTIELPSGYTLVSPVNVSLQIAKVVENTSDSSGAEGVPEP